MIEKLKNLPTFTFFNKHSSERLGIYRSVELPEFSLHYVKLVRMQNFSFSVFPVPGHTEQKYRAEIVSYLLVGR